jgi:hypothetical protein
MQNRSEAERRHGHQVVGPGNRRFRLLVIVPAIAVAAVLLWAIFASGWLL